MECFQHYHKLLSVSRTYLGLRFYVMLPWLRYPESPKPSSSSQPRRWRRGRRAVHSSETIAGGKTRTRYCQFSLLGTGVYAGLCSDAVFVALLVCRTVLSHVPHWVECGSSSLCSVTSRIKLGFPLGHHHVVLHSCTHSGIIPLGPGSILPESTTGKICHSALISW